MIENFNLKVSAICFNSSYLERKLQGLQQLMKTITGIKAGDIKYITFKDIVLIVIFLVTPL